MMIDIVERLVGVAHDECYRIHISIFPIFSQPPPTRINLPQQQIHHLEIQNPSFFQAATSRFREDISYIP